jgi:catechol 2,3-dioxygenase-like lactoylglutathione lyase family enzyme
MNMMLDIFHKPEKVHHVNPRFRAYGKARIDIAQRAASRDDWDRLWVKPAHPFPFSWGRSWKQCIEYKVADFPAEVGFFIDILGFPVNAFDPDYAMFTSPNGDFFFSVVPVKDKKEITAPDAIRLQFMVENIYETASELEKRGVKFEKWPASTYEQSHLLIGSFRTPNGISIELWGMDKLEDEDLAFLDEDEKILELELPKENDEDSKSEADQLQFLPPDDKSLSDDRQSRPPLDEDVIVDVEYFQEDEF